MAGTPNTMALERGSHAAERPNKSASPRCRVTDLIDKGRSGIDPKDAFVKRVWPEVEDDYQKMADELATRCKQELNRLNIPVAVESRVKSHDSITKSLERREIYRQTRKEDPYRDIHEILQDLHDLVGIRVIVDYLDQVEATTDFITGTFHKEKDPNIFSANRKVGHSWTSWFGAYECTNHHVSAKYQDHDPLSYFNGVMFEIQVTTLPANLYNKIAHPLLYKEEAGEMSQGDEIVIDLTKGLAFCYSLCTYYKRCKLEEAKCIRDPEMQLFKAASSATEGPEFMASISNLVGKIPGVYTESIKGKSIPRERLEMVLESLLDREIQNDIGQYVADQLRQEIKDIDRPRIELHAFGRARFDSQDVYQSPVCQEGTQTGAISYIHKWIDKGKKSLLWVCSHAGSGKSTLARTIARNITKSGQMAAGYFFRRGDVGRNHIRHVIPTIAAQLVLTIPQYESRLRKSIDACKNTDFENMLLFEQFRVLLKSPLSQVGHVLSTKVIIIDALDECVDIDQLGHVVDLLISLMSLGSIEFRLLVTSRDEDPVRAAIVRHGHKRLSLATAYHDDNISDIESILTVGFQRIRKERKVEQTWPTEEQFREVVQRSTNPSPLFIYTTTLLRFLGDGTRLGVPKKRLRSWIENSVGATFTTQLDEMYTTVFKNLDPDLGAGCSDNLTQDEKDTLRMILGAIALAVEPLSINSLADILGLDLDVLDLLKSCRAVLYVPENNDEPVQMLHKSFSDFLLRQIPQKKCWFTVDERRYNGILAQGCINHLEDKLRVNICELQDPAVSRVRIEPNTIQKYIPNSLQYASSYWVHHLQKAGNAAMFFGPIESFLCRKFLPWIECLAILGYLDRASSSIEDLRVFCQSNDSLERFLYDAYRFLLKHSPIIGRAPRQAYGSALLFSPTSSIIRNTFWDNRLPGCYNVRNMPQFWDPVLQHLSLSPEGIYVDAIALSPNGKLLASSHSNDKLEHYPKFYIELWQVVTGTHLARARISHEVISMCWARDHNNLIVLTKDGHVYRHDFLREHPIVTSTRPFGPIRTSPCNLVAISPTGVVAMAYSTDSQARFAEYARTCQVAVWDSYADKLSHVGMSLIRVSAMAISQDSRQLAVVADGTVKLVDTKTGSWSDLAACSEEYAVLAFSLDGERIFILESESFTILSISTQYFRALDTPRYGPFTGLAVSPDETSIVAYSDELLHWNVEYHNPQRREAALLSELCAPHDPRLEVSMRIEDSGYTSMITMSPDGRYLVSSWDKRLCLWRFPEGSLYKVLVPKNRCSFLYEWWFGSIVSFSRDGTSILAMCNDVAYVWVLEEDMKSDIELPANTAFDLSSVSRSYKYLNPDLEVIWMNGNTFAIVSFFSVRVCSFEHGSCHSYDVEVPKGRFVGTFAFAPGSGLLAIGQDSGVSFLSQNEGILRQTVIYLPVTSLSFSPDGSMLLMMSRDRGAMWVATVSGGGPCVGLAENFISSPVRHLAVDTGAISSDSQFNWPNDQHSTDQLSRRLSFATNGMSIRLASSVVEWYDIQHTAHAPAISSRFPMICQIHTPETETWIQLSSRRVVRIPQGYDTSTISYGGKNVALIDHRGRLVLLEFT